MKNILLLTLMGFLLVGCGSSEKKQANKEEIFNVEVAKPYRKIALQNIEFHGNVESPKVVQIKNRIDGFVEKQYFQDGGFVSKGQMLYKIDDKILKTELASLHAELQKANVTLSNLELTKKRNEKLVASNVRSQQELDNAQTAYEAQKYSIEAIKANIAKVNTNISYTSVIAPISGWIEKSQFNEGAFVSANGTYLTNIYQASPLYFTSLIPANLSKLSNATVVLNDQNITAKLAYCDPSADVSSGLIKCRYEFSSQKKIQINTLGKLYIKTDINSLFIPQTALVQGKTSKAVFVVKNNKSIMKTIIVGVWDGENVQVVSGLDENDEIVVNGIANLRDNVQVKIVSKK